MGTSLSAQSSSFLLSLLLGLCAAFLYDGLRAMRSLRRRSRFWEALLDGVFCIALAALYLAFSFRIGGGELRLYMLFSSCAGFTFYFLIFSPLLQELLRFLAGTFFACGHLLRLPFQYLKIFYGKLTKLCKRLFLFLHR